MLLSNQQQLILDSLKRLGCVTRPQLAALLRVRFCRSNVEIAEKLVDTLLRQMRFGNIDIRLDGDAVMLPGHAFDPRASEAVDVMLELSEGMPMEYSADQPPPVLLRFTTDGARIGLFAVLHAESVRDICDGYSVTPVFKPSERVVVLLDEKTPPGAFATPGKCFYARRQSNGTHRFYIHDNSEATKN